MPATLIQEAFAIGAFNTVSVSLGSPTPTGALVVVVIGGWQQNNITVTDNLGNTYTVNQAVGGFGFAACAYTYVTSPGTITVTVTPGSIGGAAGAMRANIREYDFPGSIYDQSAKFVGWYGALAPNYTGQGTNLFTLADTLVLTGTVIGATTPVTWTNPSPSGDDLVRQSDGGVPGGTISFGVFEDFATGPGTRGVILTCNRTSPSVLAIATMTFSAPLSRPGGLTEQYASRPGPGAILGVYAGQNVVELSLPYMPVVGAVLAVGAGTGAYFGAGKTLAITDNAGNVYTLQQQDPGSGTTLGRNVNCAMFTTIVALLPSSGVFKVTLTLSGGSGSYDASSLMVAEYDITPSAPITGSSYASSTSGLVKVAPVAVVTTDNYVVAFAMQFGFFQNAPVSWSQSGADVVQSSLTEAVIPGYSQVQESRMGVSALVDQQAVGAGTYASEVQCGVTNGSFGMVMIIIPYEVIPPPEPIPVRKVLNLLTSKQWSAIKEKEIQGELQTDVYIDQDFPNTGLHFWPVPAGTPTVEIVFWKPLSQFTGIEDTIDLPPAYYEALKYALAAYISQSYKRQINPAVLSLAQEKKQMMQALNAQILAGSFQPSRTLADAQISDPTRPRALQSPQGDGPGDEL